MRYASIWIIFAALCMPGCQSPPSKVAGSSGAASQAVARDGGAPNAKDAMGPPRGSVPPPPITDNDPHCEAYVTTKTPLSTAWVDQLVAKGACSKNPPTVTVTSGVPSASIFYAACTSIENTPDECTLTAGMQKCEAGHWTKLCQKNSDCPAGTVCWSPAGAGDVPAYVHPQFGTCEKTCNVAGSVDCGRCDMICDTREGVCDVKPNYSLPPP